MTPHPDGSKHAFLSNQAGLISLATLTTQGSGGTLDFGELNSCVGLTDMVHSDTEFGVMGLACHPNFTTIGLFFVSFNCDKAQVANCLGRCSSNTEDDGDHSKISLDDGAFKPDNSQGFFRSSANNLVLDSQETYKYALIDVGHDSSIKVQRLLDKFHELMSEECPPGLPPEEYTFNKKYLSHCFRDPDKAIANSGASSFQLGVSWYQPGDYFGDPDETTVNSRASSFQPGETDAGGSDTDSALSKLSDGTLIAPKYLEKYEEQIWQQFLVFSELRTFLAYFSIFGITLRTDVCCWSTTPFRKAINDVHVVGTQLCLVG